MKVSVITVRQLSSGAARSPVSRSTWRVTTPGLVANVSPGCLPIQTSITSLQIGSAARGGQLDERDLGAAETERRVGIELRGHAEALRELDRPCVADLVQKTDGRDIERFLQRLAERHDALVAPLVVLGLIHGVGGRI